jgi:hypothetical protein
MLLAAVDRQVTTLLLAAIGLIIVGLFSRAIRVLATVCTLGFALFAALLVWQPERSVNGPPALKPAAFKCPEGLWAKDDPIVETPSQVPYIEWAKKHCPGPILTVPDKASRWK